MTLDENTRDELHYWIQVLKDGEQNCDNIRSILDSVSNLLPNATALVSIAIEHKDARLIDLSTRIMDSTESALDSIHELAERLNETGKVISGRLIMLRGD